MHVYQPLIVYRPLPIYYWYPIVTTTTINILNEEVSISSSSPLPTHSTPSPQEDDYSSVTDPYQLRLLHEALDRYARHQQYLRSNPSHRYARTFTKREHIDNYRRQQILAYNERQTSLNPSPLIRTSSSLPNLSYQQEELERPTSQENSRLRTTTQVLTRPLKSLYRKLKLSIANRTVRLFGRPSSSRNQRRHL